MGTVVEDKSHLFEEVAASWWIWRRLPARTASRIRPRSRSAVAGRQARGQAGQGGGGQEEAGETRNARRQQAPHERQLLGNWCSALQVGLSQLPAADIASSRNRQEEKEEEEEEEERVWR